MEQSKNICDRLLQGLEHIETVKAVITDLLDEFTDSPTQLASTTDNSSVDTLVKDLVKNLEECLKTAQAIAGYYRVTVPWLPEHSEEETHLYYLDGQNPWAFWLILPSNKEFTHLQTSLHKAFSNGSLQKLKKLPEVGTYVICAEKKAVYRGLVLSTMIDRLKILNIDTSNTRIMKLENVYHLPKDYCQPCAQTVQCSIAEDNECLKNVWNNDLCDLFKSTFRECALSVKFIETKECIPFKYSVEVVGYNEPIERTVNINEWLNLRLLPELIKLYETGSEIDLNSLAESILNPYAEENGATIDVPESNEVPWSSSLISMPNGMVSTFACYSQLSEKAQKSGLITQYAFYAAGYSDPKSIGPISSLLKGSIPLPKASIPTPLWDPSKSVEFIPAASLSTKLNADSPSFEPQRKDSTQEKTKPVIKKETPKNVEKEQSSSNICEVYASKGYCLKGTICSKTHIHTKKEEETSNVQVNFVDGIDDDDDDFEDDPCINGGYNPRDESRICQFFAKDGYCWKRSCRKEHALINPNKYTNDKLLTSQHVFNELRLPKEGWTVQLRITSVISSISFYAQLPNKYSDIGESHETIDSLMKDLNSMANIARYRCLDIDPGFSEVFLGYSHDSKWKRVRVLDVAETQAKVFCIDFGTSEFIAFQNLRQADPQYLHLPKQVVLCHLDSIHPNEEGNVKSKGREFLESKILNEVLSGNVKYVNHELDEIYVLLTSGNVVINELMVATGFCDF